MAIHPAEPGTRQGAATPSDIARRWVGLLEVGDIEAALSLYSPNARLGIKRRAEARTPAAQPA